MEGSAATDTPDLTGEKTQYRLLRKIDLSEIDEKGKTFLSALGIADGEDVYVLDAGTYEGNVKKAAHEIHGEGEYAQVAASSWKPFPVRVKQVVSFT